MTVDDYEIRAILKSIENAFCGKLRPLELGGLRECGEFVSAESLLEEYAKSQGKSLKVFAKEQGLLAPFLTESSVPRPDLPTIERWNRSRGVASMEELHKLYPDHAMVFARARIASTSMKAKPIMIDRSEALRVGDVVNCKVGATGSVGFTFSKAGSFSNCHLGYGGLANARFDDYTSWDVQRILVEAKERDWVPDRQVHAIVAELPKNKASYAISLSVFAAFDEDAYHDYWNQRKEEFDFTREWEIQRSDSMAPDERHITYLAL